MGFWLVQVFVDAHDDVQRSGLHRSGNDHFLHADLEVRVELLWVSKFSAAFENDVHGRIFPWNDTRLRMRRERDACSVDVDGVLGRGYVMSPSPMNGIEREEMRRRRWPAIQFVYMNEVEPRAPPTCSQRQSSHPAETVDADPDAHSFTLASESASTQQAAPLNPTGAARQQPV